MVARIDDREHILQGEEAAVPEEVGSRAAKQLFEEVSRGGAVDSTHQVHCRQMVATTLRLLDHSELGAVQNLAGNVLPTARLTVCLHHRA